MDIAVQLEVDLYSNTNTLHNNSVAKYVTN